MRHSNKPKRKKERKKQQEKRKSRKKQQKIKSESEESNSHEQEAKKQDTDSEDDSYDETDESEESSVEVYKPASLESVTEQIQIEHKKEEQQILLRERRKKQEFVRRLRTISQPKQDLNALLLLNIHNEGSVAEGSSSSDVIQVLKAALNREALKLKQLRDENEFLVANCKFEQKKRISILSQYKYTKRELRFTFSLVFSFLRFLLNFKKINLLFPSYSFLLLISFRFILFLDLIDSHVLYYGDGKLLFWDRQWNFYLFFN